MIDGYKQLMRNLYSLFFKSIIQTKIFSTKANLKWNPFIQVKTA